MSTAGKVITCRAAVQWKPKEPLSIEIVEVAPPKAGEVRIKVIANSACHSDLWVMEGKTWEPRNQWPMILGHEGAGIVESVGSGVTCVQPGDHVIPLYKAQCNQCALCNYPGTNSCYRNRDQQAMGVLPDGTPRFTCKGQAVYHFMGCSTFSQYTVVADVSVCKINPAAPLEKACLLGCGIPTGYGAAVKTAKVEAGSTCAVWGLGAIGLAAIMGCKASGAKRIIGVDINPDKFPIAKKFGATEFVNPNDYDEPIESVIAKQTDGGADYTFECVGNTQTMEAAFKSCHEGWGVTVLLGVLAAGTEISINPRAITAGGKSLRGASFGGWKPLDELSGLVDLYVEGKLMVDEFITHEMELERVNEAFDLLRAGKSIRTVLKMH